MECLEKQSFKIYDADALKKLKIEGINKEIYREVKQNWDCIAKPLDSMGIFETMFAKIGAIQQTAEINISKKAILIFCADNGIVEEGISQSGQEVTWNVMNNMAKQNSTVGKMARHARIQTIPIDIGVNAEETPEHVLACKVSKGTRNFRKEPAMTEEEVLQAISIGIGLVKKCKADGYHMLGTGEMGIGNTTTSSAIVAAILGCEAKKVTGRGAGLDDKKLEKKYQVIDQAIRKYALTDASSLRILQTVGGLDIAGIAGVCIGGALYQMPIVLDGVISLSAALIAEAIVPGTKEYLLGSHCGKEPAIKPICQKLQLQPVIDGNLALGEGTGAVMLMSLLDMAGCVYHEGQTFSEINMKEYERFSS